MKEPGLDGQGLLGLTPSTALRSWFDICLPGADKKSLPLG